jgi:hypothetical protein
MAGSRNATILNLNTRMNGDALLDIHDLSHSCNDQYPSQLQDAPTRSASLTSGVLKKSAAVSVLDMSGDNI